MLKVICLESGQLENNTYKRCRNSRPEVFCKKGVLKNFAKFTEKHLCQSCFFNLVQDGPFHGCSRMGWDGGGGANSPPSINSVTHICHNDETWLTYSLPEEDKKSIYKSRDTAPWVLLTSAFFHRKSANFAISRNKDMYCILIISSSFNFFLSLQRCF